MTVGRNGSEDEYEDIKKGKQQAGESLNLVTFSVAGNGNTICLGVKYGTNLQSIAITSSSLHN